MVVPYTDFRSSLNTGTAIDCFSISMVIERGRRIACLSLLRFLDDLVMDRGQEDTASKNLRAVNNFEGNGVKWSRAGARRVEEIG